MKIFKYLAILTIATLTSCSMQISQKDIKYMDIRFEPLSRSDFETIGNLTASSTITGRMKGGKKVLDKNLAKNYNKGLITKHEISEVMYYAPKEGEAITGPLYNNKMFNSVYTPSSPLGGTMNPNGGGFSILKLFKNLSGSQSSILSDPAVDFAYYAMVNQYPEIDYFINVRFDRELLIEGRSFKEIITVKADGLKLKTD